MYPSPNIIRAMKSMRMRCVGYIARVGNRRYDFVFPGRIIKERDHFELKTYA